jgi:hypothetical protein
MDGRTFPLRVAKDDGFIKALRGRCVSRGWEAVLGRVVHDLTV